MSGASWRCTGTCAYSEGSAKLRADRAWVLGCDEVPGAKGHRPSDHRVLVVDLVPV